MKKQLLFFCLLPGLWSPAQTALTGPGSGKPIDIRDAAGRPFTTTASEIKGNPLFTESWGTGYVKFTNGRILKDISLRFNLFNSELYYKLEGLEFVFIDPVSEFSFSYEDNGKSGFAFFRNGYPGAKPRSERIFYEVLSEGNRFHLLKRNYKTIHESYGYGAIPVKAFQSITEWYIYDSQSGAVSLVKNKQPLAISVPEMATLINRIPGNETGKFRSEKELVDLVARLNQ
jgi:hypothetical protein